MIEEWKDVVGYEKYYQVSNYGNIRHIKNGVLKQTQRNKGAKYLCVHLSVNGNAKVVSVHRLVAEAFLGPPPIGHEVRHLDGNPKNNFLNNIAWGTKKENRNDRTLHGRDNLPYGELASWSKLTEKEVKLIKKSTDTSKNLSIKFDVSPSTIDDIRRRRTWKHVR